MTLKNILAAVISSALIFAACKKEEAVNTDVLNDADRKFILQSASSDTAEIILAKIALAKADTTGVDSTTRATDSLVRGLAHSILEGHRQSLKDLRNMGTIVGFTVKDSIDKSRLPTINMLSGLSGREFDSAYIYTRVEELQETIDFYVDLFANGNQRNLRSFANVYVQNIRQRRGTADSIRANIFP